MAVRRDQRRQVKDRAGNRCEYCQMPAELDVAPFQIDHVRPQKHRGATAIQNLAWACFPCNNHKSCNAAGFDPEADKMYPLFNPREQKWDEHFAWNGARLSGKIPIGRATIEVLTINAVDRVAFRKELIKEGLFPPLG